MGQRDGRPARRSIQQARPIFVIAQIISAGLGLTLFGAGLPFAAGGWPLAHAP